MHCLRKPNPLWWKSLHRLVTAITIISAVFSNDTLTYLPPLTGRKKVILCHLPHRPPVYCGSFLDNISDKLGKISRVPQRPLLRPPRRPPRRRRTASARSPKPHLRHHAHDAPLHLADRKLRHLEMVKKRKIRKRLSRESRLLQGTLPDVLRRG